MTVTEAKTYTANFTTASDGTITVNSNNASYGSATGGGFYNAGEQVTITATPEEGYFFLGWDNNGDGVSDISESIYTFYMGGDATYTALFVQGVVIYTEEVLCNTILPTSPLQVPMVIILCN